ncbi:hypothetical protein PZ938_07310 [Luteipulveratus sp. YIM 133132]|uniref:hypothetical protein n=1 Tax=Luteipulveratus flavus TaxID=3031728 RepID=UPI0023B1E521|nr:hypothetical protein [Luteipulveratus sp. YIM 133132]MDE9365410.1 hypothetical protein [Luteipulveratus sp. YIM 133132]
MKRRAVARRVVGVAAAVGLGCAAVAAARSDAPTPPPAAARPAGTSVPSASATSEGTPLGPGPLPVPAPTATAPPLVPPPTFSLPGGGSSGGGATRGPGLTTYGVHLRAQPDALGELEVVEHVFLREPVTRLVVDPRPVPELSGVEGARPAVDGLQAQAAEQPVVVPSAEGASRRARTLTLSAPTRQIVLRYHLASATVRSNPAPVGRVLSVLQPLVSTSEANLPVVVDLTGTGIRNLTCPRLPQPRQVCGHQARKVWSAGPLPYRSATVIAQIDLPTPGAS